MPLRRLQGFTATHQQQRKQQQQDRRATDQTQQPRAVQQVLDAALCTRSGTIVLRRSWRHRRRRRTFICRRDVSFRSVHSLPRQRDRYRRCRIDWRRTVSLQLGQLIVFQLDQALQLVQLALQILHPALQLGIFTPGRIQTFLSRRQLVADIFGIANCTLAIGSARRNQAQAVTTASLGRTGSRNRLPTGRIQLLGQWRGTTPITPVGILGSDFIDGLALGQLDTLRGIRHAQYLTGLEPIDVAVDKSIRVERLNRQHGLLDRAAIARLGRDFPQGVTGRGGVLTCICRRARGSRSGLRRELGRVQQYAVVPQQAAAWPHHLHQKLYEGLGQRLAGSDAQHAFAVGIDYRRKTQIIQECRTRHPGLGEFVRRCQARHHFSSGQILDVQQLDFSQQRLVLSRLQGQLSEPERLRHTG